MYIKETERTVMMRPSKLLAGIMVMALLLSVSLPTALWADDGGGG